uniref:Protein CDV3 homolog n=1 Tax=Culex tarsalis TaxID=7177 RepID=A0A1Q3F5Q5_CULTA
MADLDDFFAKKDRKKKGTVKKFATPEELAKVIEDTTKKATEVKPRKVTPVMGSSSSSGDGGGTEGSDQKAAPEPVVEEEWKEFEEERKDYSGLKLTQLNITEEEYQQGHYGGDDGGATPRENDGDRTGADSADRKAGAAWKKPGADGDDQQQQQQSAAAALAAAPRAASSLYVSPAMKNLRVKGKKGVAPDLKNEEFFPTLGTEQPDPTKSKKDGTFEEVKHGGRVRPSDMPSAAPLSVGNRFTTLSNDS